MIHITVIWNKEDNIVKFSCKECCKSITVSDIDNHNHGFYVPNSVISKKTTSALRQACDYVKKYFDVYQEIHYDLQIDFLEYWHSI
jgi:hypothetical protein